MYPGSIIVPRAARALLAAAVLCALATGRPALAGQDSCPEPNDQAEQACALSPGASVSGYLDAADDVDRYRIEVGQDQTIEASLSGLPGDYSLRLEEANGTPVIMADGAGTDDRALEARQMPRGTYFLVVYSERSAASADQPYTLSFSLADAGPVTAGGPDPGTATRRVTLEPKWLVLRLEDMGQGMLPSKFETTRDGRGSVTVQTFEPNYKGLDGPPTHPLLVLDRLWLANDIPTAQQIYQEQVANGFPDASSSVSSVGGLGLPNLGDESRGVGGCGPCDAEIVHHKIVFRYLNAVHVLYVYGEKAYAYQDVAIGYARQLDERIKAVPTGPMPDKIWSASPRELGLTEQEMGKEVYTDGQGEGSDDGTPFYWSRFKRTPEFESRHLGPLDTYDKVWVARDIATAKKIFAAQSLQKFPEAKQTVGNSFPMDYTPAVGNDNFGWSACNESCLTEKFRYLHHRLVVRYGNIVILIYAWGGNQDNSIKAVQQFAERIRDRAH